MSELAAAPADTRPYSPGLEGVIAGETALSYIDGERGRLLYRGYPIGELVRERHVRPGRGAAVDRRLGPGREAPLPARARRRCSPALRALPTTAQADGRAPDRRLGLGRGARSVVAADAGRRRAS